MKVLYTAEALATGDGRDGHGRTSDGKVDVDLSIQKELGGTGTGTNPEQLFAVGYAACYHSALRLVGRQEKADVSDSAVGAKVSLGSNDAGGFVLAVELGRCLRFSCGSQGFTRQQRCGRLRPGGRAG
ncbi:Ohr family peroxiredoxin, partial [Mycolicibacterium gadium]|uniref:Ohr family peroxiredoxin n=1 Tax=Mycolicibacterium gadium TaxID=1794 RepID=UPI0021F37A00